MKPMRTLILVLLLACAACSTKAQDPARAPASGGAASTAAAPAGDTLARIRSLTADATCTEHGQCRTVAIGANPCGGPQEYLPYSLTRTDEKALLELAARHKAERQAQNKASGMMSACRHIPDPGAVCTAGACQLGASSPSPR